MIRVFSTIVKQLDGTPFTEPDGTTQLTVGKVCEMALQAPFPEDKDISVSDAMKRYLLAQRIHEGGSTPTEVSSEDVTLLKGLIKRGYGIPVLGFVTLYLESDGPGPKAREAAGPQGLVK